MLDSLQKDIIRKLSGDVPLSLEPYKLIADELGIKEEELLSKLKELHDEGVIRRISGILYHREVGIKANAMVVWIVQEDRMDEVASIACSFSEVTHCYQRPTYPNWTYNFFTMIHGESEEKCEAVIRKISDAISIYEYRILYSTKELKKTSMKYFE